MASAIRNQIIYLRFGFSPFAINGVDGIQGLYGDRCIKVRSSKVTLVFRKLLNGRLRAGAGLGKL